MLVFDTETRIDPTQRLTFGSFQFIDNGERLSESLFYGNDLPKKDRRTLERYTLTNQRSTPRLRLLTLREFLSGDGNHAGLFKAVYKGRCLFIAFNHPFDLSRIAHDYTGARKRFSGGFSLGIWPDLRRMDRELRHKYRPRIAIKHIDSKRALIGFTGREEPDDVDLIPEDSTTGEPEPDYIFRGHFLDLHTLAFALTDENYSLETACEAFGVEHKKQRIASHGVITRKYIDYNRRDVLATSELAIKLLEEYDKHPISKSLQETKAYSPASIGKAYLRLMRIKPVFDRQRNFPKRYLGYAQSAFFGGRTSAHVRKAVVPVVYTDFRSMYPTVNSLMDLWRYVKARKIKVVQHCQAEIHAFLNRLTPDDLFKPATWERMAAFVRVVPNGDILPSRGRYSAETKDWQVAVNHLYAGSDNPNDAVWFSLPDVVASKVLYGRIPQIVDAFRIEPSGILGGLQSTQLRGAVNVDPRTQDFFRVVIEERQCLSERSDLSEIEMKRLDKALKVLANAASYGIYAEMIRQESEKKVDVTCHGIDKEPFPCRVAHPDVPGEFCFPPFASLITGAARLMLALLEHTVSRLGGTYAMEDTDSMAIVATRNGGTILCPGGQTIRALSWRQVDEISEKFGRLNPYNRKAVKGSILKIEADNRDPTTDRRRQLYCFAISAKRYVLFLLDDKGQPMLLRASCSHCGWKNDPRAERCVKCDKTVESNNKEDRWSEHGLGHLLNPTDPESEDRNWIAQIWLNMIRGALNLGKKEMKFGQLPAMGRLSISSAAMMRPFATLNEGKQYRDQIKPFNFLLTCHVRPLGHPPGANAERFHLIAPYKSKPKFWLKMPWTEQYSGKTYAITTVGDYGYRSTARVKTYREVVAEYESHAESKCADAIGHPCSKHTVGLLQRRHVRIKQIKYIGKESNSLEEVQSGTVHSAENVYTEYPDPRRDEWQTETLPALKKVPLSILVEKSGMSDRELKYIRAGKSRPHRKNRELLVSILRKLGLV